MQLKKPLLLAALTAASLSAFAQMPPHAGYPDAPPGFIHHDDGPPPDGLHHVPPDEPHQELLRHDHEPPPDALRAEFAVREIEKRLHRQRLEIEHLRNVGRITPVEAGRLRAEEEHIEHRLHEMQDHHDGCWCS